MRRADAPPPGWYPDPTGGSQLWWWDGLDWTDHRRAPPNPGLAQVEEHVATAEREVAERRPRSQGDTRASVTRTRDETAAIMAEVRKVAREEVDRGVDRLSDRARDATRRLEPLISQYGDRVMRWIRNVGIVAIALLVLWMLLQTFAQASLMDWLGERVDNLVGNAAARMP